MNRKDHFGVADFIQKARDAREANSRALEALKEKGLEPSRVKVKSKLEPRSMTSQGAKHFASLTLTEDPGYQPVTNTNVQTFIPNFAGLDELITHTDEIIGLSSPIRRDLPGYLSSISKLYYSIIGMIRTMECQIQLGIANPEMSRTVREFRQTFPPAKLHIDGITAPWIEQLSYSKCSNGEYGHVSPAIPAFADFNIANGTHNIPRASLRYYLPNIRAMAMKIHKMLINAAIPQNQVAYHLQIPDRDLTTCASSPNNVPNPHTSANNLVVNLRMTPGSMYPDFVAAQNGYGGYQNSVRLPRFPSQDDADAFATFEEYLLLNKPLRWFESLLDFVTTRSKYISDATTEDKLPTIGTGTNRIQNVPHEIELGEALAAFNAVQAANAGWNNVSCCSSMAYANFDAHRIPTVLNYREGKVDSRVTASAAAYHVNGFSLWHELLVAAPAVPIRAGPFWNVPTSTSTRIRPWLGINQAIRQYVI